MCELVQLNVVVDPAILYGQHYAYRSAPSAAWRAHCQALAFDATSRGDRVLEIGCLDGVMLNALVDAGCEVMGCDPSAPDNLTYIRRHLFTKDTRLGQFDTIIAQNVLGHVDDARGFLEGIVANLAPGGDVVIECPWVVEMIDGLKWDTIYHEHLSYWGLRPLMRLAQEVGLTVNLVQEFPKIHGGTMRYYLSTYREVDPKVCKTWEDEEMEAGDFERFRLNTQAQIAYWNSKFALSKQRIAAYGASAKLNTFLNALPVKPPLVCVFDDSPAKQGLVTPGWGFPVIKPEKGSFRDLDALLIGSPNWSEGLQEKARSLGFEGTFLSLW